MVLATFHRRYLFSVGLAVLPRLVAASLHWFFTFHCVGEFGVIRVAQIGGSGRLGLFCF